MSKNNLQSDRLGFFKNSNYQFEGAKIEIAKVTFKKTDGSVTVILKDKSSIPFKDMDDFNTNFWHKITPLNKLGEVIKPSENANAVSDKHKPLAIQSNIKEVIVRMPTAPSNPKDSFNDGQPDSKKTAVDIVLNQLAPSNYSEINDILKENIARVGKDKDFIPQANVVASFTRQMIDVERAKIETIRAVGALMNQK